MTAVTYECLLHLQLCDTHLRVISKQAVHTAALARFQEQLRASPTKQALFSTPACITLLMPRGPKHVPWPAQNQCGGGYYQKV